MEQEGRITQIVPRTLSSNIGTARTSKWPKHWYITTATKVDKNGAKEWYISIAQLDEID